MRKRGLRARAARLSSTSYDCADPPAARLAAIGRKASRERIQSRDRRRVGNLCDQKRVAKRRFEAHGDFTARAATGIEVGRMASRYFPLVRTHYSARRFRL